MARTDNHESKAAAKTARAVARALAKTASPIEVSNLRDADSASAAFVTAQAEALALLDEIRQAIVNESAIERPNYADAGTAIERALRLAEIRDALAGTGEYSE